MTVTTSESQRREGVELDDVRRDFYDSYVESQYRYLNDLSDEGYERSIGAQGRSLVGLLPEDRSARILEIGCGNGAFLQAAARAGYGALKGIDASRQQVEYCTSRGLDAECVDGAEFLRQSSEFFDAIVMSDVLEHMTKDYAMEVLRGCRSALRPGGRVITRVPNMSNPLNLRTRYADMTHGIGFSVESLSQALRATDFEIDRVYGDFGEDPRWLVRLVFDRFLWWAYRQFVKRTMHLPFPIVRGKNLIGVGVKPAIEQT